MAASGGGELPQVPPGLQKKLGPILKHAAQLRAQVPFMSYLCTLYAAQLGLKLKGTDTANKVFLMQLMESLERQRGELGSSLPPASEQKVLTCSFLLVVNVPFPPCLFFFSKDLRYQLCGEDIWPC